MNAREGCFGFIWQNGRVTGQLRSFSWFLCYIGNHSTAVPGLLLVTDAWVIAARLVGPMRLLSPASAEHETYIDIYIYIYIYLYIYIYTMASKAGKLVGDAGSRTITSRAWRQNLRPQRLTELRLAVLPSSPSNDFYTLTRQ